MKKQPESVPGTPEGTPPVFEKHSMEDESKRKSFCSWCLLISVAICLAWVMIFTILATHTDFMRSKVYETFDTEKYLSNKAGTRLFTYLVVFFVVPGIMTHAARKQTIQLPTPNSVLVRSISLPSWKRSIIAVRLSPAEGIAIFLILATEISTFVTRIVKRFEFFYWPPARVWYEVSKTMGKVVAINMMILLFPVSKSSFWWCLFNYHFERVIKWHRWISWMLVVVVMLHSISASVAFIQEGSLGDCWIPNENCRRPGGFEYYKGEETSRIFFYGWISVALGFILVITSIPYFRRRHFEWFYYTHVAVFLPLLVVMHLHYPDLIYYMAPGLTAYLLDKVVWFYTSRRSTRITALFKPAPGFVRIEIEIDPRQYDSYEPGKWVQLNIPAVSFWEWHPMTLASGPICVRGASSSTVTIDIKVLGDWTTKLSSFTDSFDPANVSQSTVFLDNFYGSSHSSFQGFLSHPVVVLFGGGVGATPAMSSLRDIVQNSQTKYPHIRKVVFTWCVKKISVTKLYDKELAYYQKQLPVLESGCELEVLVHATLSEEEDPEASFDEVRQNSPFLNPGSTIQGTNSTESATGQIERLTLVVLAGCSFWLGLFLSRVVSNEKEWSNEAISMLQLLFPSLLTVLSVTFGLVLLSNSSPYDPDPDEATKIDEKDRSHHEQDSGSDSEAAGCVDLDMIIGRRPNAKKLFKKLKRFCRENGFKNVGVSVCGPAVLVDSVYDAASRCSAKDVEFVVDEESFDW